MYFYNYLVFRVSSITEWGHHTQSNSYYCHKLLHNNKILSVDCCLSCGITLHKTPAIGVCTLSPCTIYISPTEEDYGFDNSTFKFDGCNSRSCVNVTIINDKRAEPLTRFRRDIFDVALTGSNLDGITLSPYTASVYINDDDCTSFLCRNCICTYTLFILASLIAFI
jgi:hypothetical protein